MALPLLSIWKECPERTENYVVAGNEPYNYDCFALTLFTIKYIIIDKLQETEFILYYMYIIYSFKVLMLFLFYLEHAFYAFLSTTS